MKSIEQTIQDEILKKALAKIDVDKLIEKLMPKILESLEKNILTTLDSLDWDGLMYEDMPVEELGRLLNKKIKEAIKLMK